MKGKGETIYTFLFYGIIAVLVIWFVFFRNNPGGSLGSVPASETPIPTVDFVTYTPIPTYTYRYCQGYGYWYCWNSGNPAPHHVGHPVYGDHLCTYQELGCQ